MIENFSLIHFGSAAPIASKNFNMAKMDIAKKKTPNHLSISFDLKLNILNSDTNFGH